MADKERVGIFNLSKLGRGYDVAGFEDGKILRIAPGRTVEVPAAVAAFMLGKLPNGRARYPDLVDAAKISPEATEAKEKAVAENKRLLTENADLKAQLEALAEGKKEKTGGKK